MRVLVIAALVVCGSASAFAFDGPKAAKEYDTAAGDCRMAQTADGKDLSTSEWDRVCAKRDRLAKQLKANRYCWDTSEQEWYPCKFGSFVDYANRTEAQ